MVRGRGIPPIGVVLGIQRRVAEVHHREGVAVSSFGAEVVVVVDHQRAVIAQGEAFRFVVTERAAHRRQVEELHLVGKLDAGGGQSIGAGGGVDPIHQGEAVVEQLGAGHADGVRPGGSSRRAGLGGGHHTELADFYLAGGRSNGLVDLISDQEVAVFGCVVTADASEEGGDINDA